MQIELAPIRVPDVSINNQDGSVPNGPHRSLFEEDEKVVSGCRAGKAEL